MFLCPVNISKGRAWVRAHWASAGSGVSRNVSRNASVTSHPLCILYVVALMRLPTATISTTTVTATHTGSGDMENQP